MPRPAFYIALLIVLPIGAPAQIVVGRVLDDATNAPVSEADVYVLDARAVNRTHALTDSTGAFQFEVPGRGRYVLRVDHIGYATFLSAPVEVDVRETVEIEIRLGRTAIPLEPLIVTARSSEIGRLAGFHERMETEPFGRFVTREQIERRPAASVTDFFRTMAGVHVVPAKRGGNPDGMTVNLVLMRGTGTEPAQPGVPSGQGGMCTPALVLDGVRIHQSATYPIDDLLAAYMLEGIEVYTSAAVAPPELRASTSCGVVALWTRQSENDDARRSNWKRNVIGIAAFGVLLLLIR